MNGALKTKKKVGLKEPSPNPRTVLKRPSLKNAGGAAGAAGQQMGSFEDEDMYQEPIKQVVRPPNQLDLSETELKEEHTRVLTATDPNGMGWRTSWRTARGCIVAQTPVQPFHQRVSALRAQSVVSPICGRSL